MRQQNSRRFEIAGDARKVQRVDAVQIPRIDGHAVVVARAHAVHDIAIQRARHRAFVTA